MPDAASSTDIDQAAKASCRISRDAALSSATKTLNCLRRSGGSRVGGDFNSAQKKLSRECEDAADLCLARNNQLATQQFDELLADGETEARATEAASDRGVSLGKGRKELLQLLRRHSDASVPHRDFHRNTSALISKSADRQGDLDRRRELYGVADEVDDDLVEPERIADQSIWSCRVNDELQFDSLLQGGQCN